jgi:hypothetical protein
MGENVMRILTDSELEAVAGGLSITATSSLSVATSAVTTIAAGGASCALGANATGAGTSEAAMIEARVQQLLLGEAAGTSEAAMIAAQVRQLLLAKLQALAKLP